MRPGRCHPARHQPVAGAGRTGRRAGENRARRTVRKWPQRRRTRLRGSRLMVPTRRRTRETPSGRTTSASCNSIGRGVGHYEAEAVGWYRRAAEQGDALGQNNLGVMYRDGRGVGQDAAEAVRWLRRAAEQGEAQGQSSPRLHVRERSRRGAGLRGSRPVVPPGLPSRETPTARFLSASHTRTVTAWSRTTRKPSGGSAGPPSRETPTAR